MNNPKYDGAGVTKSTQVNWKLIAAGGVGLLALIFILQNTERGTIEFLFFDWTVGVWLALTITFVLGLAVGLLLPRFFRDNE